MHILFVCTGNVCRSAMAEALLRRRLADRGVAGVTAASRGTGALPSFRVPGVVLRLMQERGIDMSGHRPLRVAAGDVEPADRILVMEREHREAVAAVSPSAAEKTFLFREYVSGGKGGIPDPMGLPDEAYARTAEEIERCVDLLVERLSERNHI